MTMKKVKWAAIALMMAMTVGGMLTACSSDDESKDTIAAVRGGEVYNSTKSTDVDPSDQVAVFFNEELGAVYYSDKSVNKSFFTNEESDLLIDKCLVINNRQEFEDAYMGTKDLPIIDFDSYTLIIGRTWGRDSSYKLRDVSLKDTGTGYQLEINVLHEKADVVLYTLYDIQFWRLYPKLASKPVAFKNTVSEEQ